MTYDREATTGEADAFRAGQAILQERINLALTHLRAELERGGFRDTTRVRAAYAVLGGVGAAEAVEPAQPPQETLAEASARKHKAYAAHRARIQQATDAAYAAQVAMVKQVSA